MNDHDAAIVAVKTAPPLSVVTLQTLFGVALPDVINVLTVIWLCCLIVPKLYHGIRFLTGRKWR